MFPMCLVAAVPFGTPESVISADNNIAPTTNLSDEYVQMLETLVTGLSLQVVQQTQPDLVAPHVHNQNMPNVGTQVRHVAQTSETYNTVGEPTETQSLNLPDLVNPSPRTSFKKPSISPSPANSHPSQELRVRRGYTPLRCRLDSLSSAGSSAPESATSTPFSTMESLMTPTPHSFNPASPSLSPSSALYHHYAVPHIFNWSLTTPPQSPDMIPSSSPVFALDFPLEPEDMAQYQQREESSSTWREVGHDLRRIADNFASGNQQNGIRGANNAGIASILLRNCDAKFPTVCSALVAYVLWRLLKRFVAP